MIEGEKVNLSRLRGKEIWGNEIAKKSMNMEKVFRAEDCECCIEFEENLLDFVAGNLKCY
jgi:hypothetical protein